MSNYGNSEGTLSIILVEMLATVSRNFATSAPDASIPRNLPNDCNSTDEKCILTRPQKLLF